MNIQLKTLFFLTFSPRMSILKVKNLWNQRGYPMDFGRFWRFLKILFFKGKITILRQNSEDYDNFLRKRPIWPTRMDEEHYQKIVKTLQDGSIPPGVSTPSNWKRMVAKFRVKTLKGEPTLFRVLTEDEQEVERLVLKKGDLDRVWEEVHVTFHAGRNKT